MHLLPTDSKTDERANRLRDLIQDDGITPLTVLDPEFRRLFALTTEDPNAFVQILILQRSIMKDSPQIQAAYFALGIDAMELGNLDQRRDTLLKKRHGQHWDVEHKAQLEIDERHGFRAIAEQYDQAMALKMKSDELDATKARLKDFAKTIRKFASTERLVLRQQVALNHAADKADPEGAGPKV